jgi:23S rRNA (adenine-C8)-methyltransferase
MSFNPKIQKISLLLEDLNEPSFRLKQIEDYIYKKGLLNFDDFTSLPIKLREDLKEKFTDTQSLKVLKESIGSQSHKVLFETKEGSSKIEAIRMTYLPNIKQGRSKPHYSLCISSQSGCALACTFCATGAIGLKKNLTAEEISDQVLYFKQKGLQIDSIVFMGMGEPFANPNVFDALKILTDPVYLGMSERRISVSTVGIIPGIKRFIEEYPQMNLAFSLHSPFEEERLKIMPVTKSFPLKDCLEIVKEYVEKTNNKIFIAYILLKGVNDTPKHAKAVADLINKQGKKKYLYHVNLIRFHPGSTLDIFEQPIEKDVQEFKEIIEKHGIVCTIRQSFGLDIDGACGQLYAEYQDKRNKIPN